LRVGASLCETTIFGYLLNLSLIDFLPASYNFRLAVKSICARKDI
jgi:hypothetical protein